MPDERAIVQELYNRRSTLSPDQQAVVSELARRHGISGPVAGSTQSQSDPITHGISEWWKEVNPVEQVKGLAHAAAHPIDTLRGMGEAQDVPRQKAMESFGKGDVAEGVRHLLHYAIPVLGPQLDAKGDQAQSGDVSGAIGGTAGIATNMLGPKLAADALKNVKVGPIVKNVNNPTVEAALQSVEPDVRMDVGQRTGNRMLQRVGRNLENYYGSDDAAHQFYQGQEADLAAKGNKLASAASPTQTNEFGAGRGVQDRLQQRITRLKGQADNLYGQVRKATAANQQTVQVGTKPSAILGPNGAPVTTPVMQTFETPVDLAPIRSQLAPIYEDLQRSMPEARRAASPAFRALQDLMESDHPQMSAMDFDRSLGAIKSLTRNGESPFLTSQSQGIAKKIVGAGEAQLDQALNSAGPNVKAKLTSARKAVASYHDTAELLGDLNDEPGRLYSNLVTGGDRSFNTLTELQRVAPNELKTVGRTFLEGLMQKAGEEGGFTRAAGVFRDWQKLGPETKQLMFGKQLTDDLDNFFLASKKLGEAGTGSRTAPVQSAMKHFFNPYIGAVAETGLGAIAGHPEVGAAAGVATIGASDTIPRLTAKLLMTPGGSRLLTQALQAPVGSPAFEVAKRAIQARVALGGAEDQEKTQ